MKYVKQFLIIVAVSFAGEIIRQLVPFPIPASIYGLVILFLLLLSGIVKLEHVRETGQFLIDIMGIMFVPATVGIMDRWDYVVDSWHIYVVFVVISAFLVMGISALSAQLVSKHKEGKK